MPGFTCLVELKELLLQFLSVGLVAMSSEPLHAASAPVWSLKAHRPAAWREQQEHEKSYHSVNSETSFYHQKQVRKNI